MQFKKAGKRIQVLAYRGYDKEKRRAIVKLMGSLDVRTYEIAEGFLFDELTGNERDEFDGYIAEALTRKAREDEIGAAENLAANIDKAIRAIKDGFVSENPSWKSDVLASVEGLQEVAVHLLVPTSD